MTTTELIKFLQKYEFGGATGKPREVHICADGKIYDFDIKNFSTGDGLITELYIDLGECEKEWVKMLYGILDIIGDIVDWFMQRFGK